MAPLKGNKEPVPVRPTYIQVTTYVMLAFLVFDFLALVLDITSLGWVLMLAVAGIVSCFAIIAKDKGNRGGYFYIALLVVTTLLSILTLGVSLSKVETPSEPVNALTKCLDAKSTAISDSISSLSDKETADYYTSILENMETEASRNRIVSYTDFCQRVAGLNIDVKESVLIEAKQ